MNPIIDVAQLKEIGYLANLVIVDARSSKEKYDQSHLSGAIHFDLDTQMSDIKDDVSKGGRHPLPEVGDFLKTLSATGISPQNHIVIYDDMGGANAAARLWWMLRAVGHEQVQVLNGGYQTAVAEGIACDAQEVQLPWAYEVFEAEDWLVPIASLEEVKEVSKSGGQYIIDVRAAARYRGEIEPIDLVAGHIPNAHNIPLTENLDEAGLFRSPEALRELYQPLQDRFGHDQIIVHCGSGVTACHTLLAMNYAGYDVSKLYVGSWSEWSRLYLPMATGADSNSHI